ncbi:UvrD-helicase domain-containing protein [Lacinutrix salivirga]
MVTSYFKIYNASAGSGKTFTLVKEYLKILFNSSKDDYYKHILAITFTNKAVGEMKERIIETLKEFSNPSILKTPNSMFAAISEELELESEILHLKSKKILNSIIYNYAAFDVSTIDGFTHKIIRTFAYDLKLPLNFEVELDQDSLLNEAVDSLIAKAGTNKELTQVLVDFAIEKADDDKSWDITFDLNIIAKLLVNENDIPYLQAIKDKTLDDFKTLKTLVIKKINTNEAAIVKTAEATLTLIEECGLQYNDFSSSYLPKHFQKLASKDFNLNFENKWQLALLASETLYPKRVTPDISSIINNIQPQLIDAFITSKTLVFNLKFLKAIYKNITPLSVLNAINTELDFIKQDQNKMLISEFNAIISKEIKDQPTPFIYERLGEKFKHYFIDEFQDTSTLQWENLIPLIDNALASESLKHEQGTAMLVGDAKQAIYRWRGGKAEQFIDLFTTKSQPFYIKQDVENLPTNYRSFKEIVNFNNALFQYLATTALNNEEYSKLYLQTASQNPFLEHEGYVNINFLDITKEDNREEMYVEEAFNTIQTCLKNGYALKDICVLVRKKKEGIAIAQYLSEKEIKITSSETMLINNSEEVRFITNFLRLLLHPKDDENKIKVLNYIANKYAIEDKHQFFANTINLTLSKLLKQFEAFEVYLTTSVLLQLPIYELAETIVRHFNLVTTSNAYIQFYLDFILEYSQKQDADLSGFISYFESKKESLSIVTPKGLDAVQIMTIHKSKGLEFPVVIFPFADLDIYREREPKEWFPLIKEDFNQFPHTLLNYNKDFEHFGTLGEEIYNKHQSELELDNINLLYVTLTRAVEQLHIISKLDISAKGEVNKKTYAGLFIGYLQQTQHYNDSQTIYSFGNPKKITLSEPNEKETLVHNEFISTPKEAHNINILTTSGYLWDTLQEDALEKGNLIHDIMTLIETENDVESALLQFLTTGIINEAQKLQLNQTINSIIKHPELHSFYTTNYTIYNERDIISKNGKIVRPDRLAINNTNQATIIDYKTGLSNPKYKEQLQDYQDALESMNYKVENKILVYINKDIKVQFL